VNTHRQAADLELCDSVYDRTVNGETATTIHKDGDSSSGCFRGSDISHEVHDNTRNRIKRNLHAGSRQSNGCWHRPTTTAASGRSSAATDKAEKQQDAKGEGGAKGQVIAAKPDLKQKQKE